MTIFLLLSGLLSDKSIRHNVCLPKKCSLESSLGHGTWVHFNTPPGREFPTSTTPIFSRSVSKGTLGRPFVNMSAIISFVGQYEISICFFDIKSLTKWYFISICFVLEWCVGFSITLLFLGYLRISSSSSVSNKYHPEGFEARLLSV